MAIKAIAVDDNNTQHLIIGLNRENIESLLRGDMFRLPRSVSLMAEMHPEFIRYACSLANDLALCMCLPRLDSVPTTAPSGHAGSLKRSKRSMGELATVRFLER
jgi:hypothetical protein